MSTITTALSAASTLFAAVAGLVVLVTGFFVGKWWLEKLDDDEDKAYLNEFNDPFDR